MNRILKKLLSEATLARVMSPIPVVELKEIQYYDGRENFVLKTTNEDHELTFVIDTVDGANLIKAINYNGGFYRPDTLLSIGVQMCTQCRGVCGNGHLVNGICTMCRRFTEAINIKASPQEGWQRLGSAPYVGIELEMELPVNRRISSLDSFREILRRKEWYLPMAWCGDQSLHYGVEINTHLMGLDWITANESLLTDSLNTLKAAGATHKPADQRETAGLHIHIDDDICYNHNRFQLWLKTHYQFCLFISGREEERFKHWCWKGATCSYDYFGPRNRSTWECRGFSARALLEHPEALKHIVAWVHTLAYVSNNVPAMFMTLKECFILAGFQESGEYWAARGAPGMDVVHPITQEWDSAIRRSMRDQAVRLVDGQYAWIREISDENYQSGRVYGHMGGVASTTYIAISDIAEYTRVQPPAGVHTEESLSCVS